MDSLARKLPIDVNQLHLCCEHQPQLAHEAGELAAESKAQAKRMKVQLEEAKANASRDVRTSPGKFGMDKVTEAAVSAAISLHPDVTKSQQDSIEADLIADKAAALANAFEHRRSMLKIEAELYVHNYHGEIAVRGGDMAAARESLADSAEPAINDGVRARKGTRKRRGSD